MCINCSFSSSPTKAAANWLIKTRDECVNEDMAERPNEDGCDSCCKGFAKGCTKFAFGFYSSLLLAVSVVGAVARVFFAVVTLPIAFFDDGKEFYKRVSMQGLINSFDAVKLLTYAFFANFFEKSITIAHVNDSLRASVPNLPTSSGQPQVFVVPLNGSGISGNILQDPAVLQAFQGLSAQPPSNES